MNAPKFAVEDARSLAERRAAWRFGCGAARLVRLYLPDKNLFVFSWVHDVSTTGIAFDLITPVESGQELLFQLKRSEQERVDVAARVVHTTVNQGFCRVGCQFEGPLAVELFRAVVQQLRGERESE